MVLEEFLLQNHLNKEKVISIFVIVGVPGIGKNIIISILFNDNDVKIMSLYLTPQRKVLLEITKNILFMCMTNYECHVIQVLQLFMPP